MAERYYDPSKNPREERYIPGVPLHDIDKTTWDGYDARVQAQVDASGMYYKSRRPGGAHPSPVTDPGGFPTETAEPVNPTPTPEPEPIPEPVPGPPEGGE